MKFLQALLGFIVISSWYYLAFSVAAAIAVITGQPVVLMVFAAGISATVALSHFTNTQEDDE